MPAPPREDALVVTDVQNDFLPGGTLAVPHGERIMAPINRLIDAFRRRRLPVVFTQDWHPRAHCSFQSRGGPWPAHCVQRTRGARLSSALRIPPKPLVVRKATHRDREAYSAFDGTRLDRILHGKAVHRIFLAGLATDYCVLRTALDARRRGYVVELVKDATRGVNLRPGDSLRALRRMKRAGVHPTSSGAGLRELRRAAVARETVSSAAPRSSRRRN